jgi:antitoxin ParD1/3/4
MIPTPRLNHRGTKSSYQALHSTAGGYPRAASEKRTFSLPSEQATYIDSLVASGTYASASEVIRAGLRALQERDGAVEKFLREEVIDTYDAMQANPARAIPAEQVFAAIRARHADKTRKRAGES